MGKSSVIRVTGEEYVKLSVKFYEYVERLGYNGESNRTRQLGVNEFLWWLEQRGQREIGEVSRGEIGAYREYLSGRENRVKGGRLSPKSVCRLLQVVRDFLEMLVRDGCIGSNPCSGLQFVCHSYTPERKVLSREEIGRLWEVTESHGERALLSLGYGCGLRSKEVERCNTQDVHLRDRLLIVPQGKGNKRRVIPLNETVTESLSAYYETERVLLSGRQGYRQGEQAFLLNLRGGRMKSESFNRRLGVLVDRTGNPALKAGQITMHTLRHSIATHLLQEGMPIEQVKMFLGHSQLETTQLYTHITSEQIDRLI